MRGDLGGSSTLGRTSSPERSGRIALDPHAIASEVHKPIGRPTPLRRLKHKGDSTTGPSRRPSLSGRAPVPCSDDSPGPPPGLATFYVHLLREGRGGSPAG